MMLSRDSLESDNEADKINKHLMVVIVLESVCMRGWLI